MLDKKERLAVLFFGIAAASFIIGLFLVLRATVNEFGFFGMIGTTNSAIEIKRLFENQPDYIHGLLLGIASLVSAFIAVKISNS